MIMGFLIQNLEVTKLQKVGINWQMPVMKLSQKAPDAPLFTEQRVRWQDALLGTSYT